MEEIDVDRLRLLLRIIWRLRRRKRVWLVLRDQGWEVL
jgi:hypothetical protein